MTPVADIEKINTQMQRLSLDTKPKKISLNNKKPSNKQRRLTANISKNSRVLQSQSNMYDYHKKPKLNKRFNVKKSSRNSDNEKALLELDHLDKIVKISRRKTGKLSTDNIPDRTINYIDPISDLYNYYSIQEQQVTLEHKVIIDICEGIVSSYVSNNSFSDRDAKKRIYETYCLGFIHLMNPENCIDFINHIFELENIGRNKCNILYRFCCRLLKTAMKHKGSKYLEWLNSLKNINSRRFKSHIENKLPSTRPIDNSSDIESYLIFNHHTLDNINFIQKMLKSTHKEHIKTFSCFLSEAFNYNLSFISDYDFLNLRNSENRYIENYSRFDSNYFMYICKEILSESLKSGNPENTIQTLHNYINILIKSLAYVTKNNMQHVGLSIHAFLNIFEVSRYIDKDETLSKLISRYKNLFHEYYDPSSKFKGIYKNKKSRWPVLVLKSKLNRLTETSSIEANLQESKNEIIIKLTEAGTIHTYGAITDLFITKGRVVAENNTENNCYEINYGDVEEFKIILEELYDLYYDF